MADAIQTLNLGDFINRRPTIYDIDYASNIPLILFISSLGLKLYTRTHMYTRTNSSAHAHTYIHIHTHAHSQKAPEIRTVNAIPV